MKKIKIVFVLACLGLLSCTKGDEGYNFATQLDKDTKAIDNYLSDHSINAYKDVSGVRFVINSLGTGGLPPKTTSTVIVKYTGTLLGTTTVFDQNTTDGISGFLSTFISGWQIGLAILPKGTKATLYIPSGLGYGNIQTGFIPVNSNLVFDLELVDVIKTSTEIQQLSLDVTKIDDYLKDSANVVQDTTGLRYVIKEEGTGIQPTWFDKVSIKYTGKIMSTGAIFFTGTNEPVVGFDSRVVDYLHGFVVGLQKMKKGGKARFYIPSGLGFGAKVAGTTQFQIPANTNLIYDIELLDVVN